MRRAGRVIGEAQGVLVLRSEEDRPGIGTSVLDERLTEIGTVVDVFGPVEHPYLAVSPADDVGTQSRLSDVLYVR